MDDEEEEEEEEEYDDSDDDCTLMSRRNENYLMRSCYHPIILPPSGHTGIADTQGVIHDFAGPYSIGVGEKG